MSNQADEWMRIRVQATREGGTVNRCHAMSLVGQYNVAQHSYGAVSLLLLLHPGPSLLLVKAVQWHDVGERWMGDMPSPAKTINPRLKEVYEEAEDHVLATLGIPLPKDLPPEDQNWLRAVDLLDLWLFSREELYRGNQTVKQCLQACADALDDMWSTGTLPVQVERLLVTMHQQPHARLSDFFHEVFDRVTGREPHQA